MEKEGCGLGRYVRGTKGDVTHARGTVNASAIRQTHEAPSLPPPHPPTAYLERTEFPHCYPPARALSLPSHLLPPARCPLYHPPRILLCRQMRAIRPMLNATFDSLHLRRAPHTHLSSALAILARRSTLLSCAQFIHLVRLYARLSRAHAVFIDSCQS